MHIHGAHAYTQTRGITKAKRIVLDKWRPLSKSNDAAATLVDNDNEECRRMRIAMREMQEESCAC